MLHTQEKMRHSKQQGFSLLELSIVVVIVTVVTGMAMSSGYSVLKSSKLAATQNKIKAIDAALLAFRNAYDRLPCPADITIAESATNYGVEGATPGTCTGGTPAANRSAAGATYSGKTGVEGGVPIVALGLPNDMAYDGWGNKFRYAVDQGLTSTGAISNMATSCNNRAITIKDYNGNNISGGALYAIISHGENAHGGYTRKGVITSTGSTNTDEQTNCHCNSSAAATTYAPTYVQKITTQSAATATNAFDDIVSYKERWEMLSAWEAPTTCPATQYVYVYDSVNGRISKFDTDGGFIAQVNSSVWGWGSTPLSTMQFDSAGNMWVVIDTHIGKLTAASNYATLVDMTSTFDIYNRCGSVSGFAIDSSDNLYFVCNNSNMQKYTSAGAYAGLQIGQTCTGPAPSWCDYSSADDGLMYPSGIAVDTSGNIYISDDPTGYIKKFSSAGAFITKNITIGPLTLNFSNGHLWGGNQHDARLIDTTTLAVTNTIGTYSCCHGGEFERAVGIGEDSYGYIWIADYMHNNVQRMKISDGSYSGTTLGCAPSGASPCATSSANGRFNFPTWAIVRDN